MSIEELKRAHENGAEIEVSQKGKDYWVVTKKPEWDNDLKYRIKRKK